MTEGQAWYRDKYLRSPHWRETRSRIHQRWGYQCAIFGCRLRRINVHHLAYDFLGTERELADLRPLCWWHHFLAHYKIFAWRKIPLTREQLTKRYYEIRRTTWRAIRPSDICNL